MQIGCNPNNLTLLPSLRSYVPEIPMFLPVLVFVPSLCLCLRLTDREPVRIESDPCYLCVDCPEGWTSYSGSNNCVKIMMNNGQCKTWSQAEAQCVEQGGHLASVHSGDQNAILEGLLNGAGASEYLQFRK